MGILLVGLCRPVGRRAEAGGGAKVDIGPALFVLAVVVVIGADDDVGKAVAVDIARGADRDAEIGTCLVGGLAHLHRDLIQPGGGTKIDGNCSFVHHVAVKVGRADDDVGKAVTVDIARGPDRGSETGTRLVGLCRPVGDRVEAGCGAVEDIGPALAVLAVVVPTRADDDVGKAIIVDITRGPDRATEEGKGLVRLGRPGGRGGEWVDKEGVLGGGGGHGDVQVASAQAEPGRQFPAGGIDGQQVAEVEPGLAVPGGKGQGGAVGIEAGDQGAAHRHAQHQFRGARAPRRRFVQGEALFEATLVVLVPFRQRSAHQFDPAAAQSHPGRLGTAQVAGRADRHQGQAPGPVRVGGGARFDQHALGREGGAEVVGPVGRLQDLGLIRGIGCRHRTRLVLGPADMRLRPGPPVGGHTGRQLLRADRRPGPGRESGRQHYELDEKNDKSVCSAFVHDVPS